MGQTPVLRHSYRYDRTSTISAITVSPRQRRFGLYAHCHHQNITGEEVVLFLRDLRRSIPGRLVLLWDGLPVHRRALVLNFLRRHKDRVQVHRFPAYAPELNPDEQVWTQLKAHLANTTPHSLAELDRQLDEQIIRLSRSQVLLWSCITASDLPWRKE
jgi:transposase